MTRPGSSLPHPQRGSASTAQSSPHSPAHLRPESSHPRKSPASIVSSRQAPKSPQAASASVAPHVDLATFSPVREPNPQVPALRGIQPFSPHSSRYPLTLPTAALQISSPQTFLDSLDHGLYPSRVNRRAIFCPNTSNSLQPSCTWPTLIGTFSETGEKLSNT